jgi:hypothetical protein
MLKEFRDFLMRGNIVELAVAFVIGVAFAAVINAFVDDLVMPLVAMIIGKPNFDSLTFTINDAVCLRRVIFARHLRRDRGGGLLRRQADAATAARRAKEVAVTSTTRSAATRSCSRRCAPPYDGFETPST